MRQKILALYLLLSLTATVTAQTVHPDGTVLDTSLVELPALSPDDCIIVHEGYVSCYDSGTLNPKWVAYELTATELDSTATEREGSFRKDPFYPGRQASNSDYTKSGYDKGHIAPAADFKWSATAMKESFYFTNISPQTPALNRQHWLRLEEMTRDAARTYGKVWVISGSICESDSCSVIGKNGVTVPDIFWKALLAPDGDGYVAVAFKLRNDGSEQKPEDVVISVDNLETIIGLDLFRKVGEAGEKAEKTAELERWAK